MSDFLAKLVYAVVKALIDSGALAMLRKYWQESLTEASKPNKDDETFVANAESDGW